MNTTIYIPIEKIIIISFLFGIFILTYILLNIYLWLDYFKIRRHEKYLIETKQSQRYNEYLESLKSYKSKNYKRLFQ